MIEKTKLCTAAQRLMFSAVVLCASNVHALGLGGIQVNSYLGEPLKAQVPVHQLPDSDVEDVKIRLGNMDEYQKHKLQYPSSSGFKFHMVSEPGGKRYIRVSTTQPIEEPFLDLVINFSSPSGKVTRAFTFLVDPEPEMTGAPVVAAAPVESDAPVTEFAKPLPDFDKPVKRKTKRKKVKANKVATEGASASLPMSFAGDAGALDAPKEHAVSKKTKKIGTMSLALSTSLTISKADPGRANSPDAIQEEIVVKEKQLKELNSQVAELQTAVNRLHSKASGQGGAVAKPAVSAQPAVAPTPAVKPAVIEPHNVPPVNVAAPQPANTATIPPASEAPVQVPAAAPTTEVASASAAPQVESVAPVTKTAPPVNPALMAVVEGDDDVITELIDWLDENLFEALGGLAFLLAVTGGMLFYNKRKGSKGGSASWTQQNPFKRAPKTLKKNTPEPVKQTTPQPTATIRTEPKSAAEPVVKQEPSVKPVARNATPTVEPSMAVDPPAIKTVDRPVKPSGSDFSAPPEYDLLEEADIYLRFGHNKLAEEVLREAIKMNPSNPHSYVTLLGVYEMRGDVKEFEGLAKQLKAFAGAADWEKAAEMGRKLDPDNPLYA